jgi:hypothetical protein
MEAALSGLASARVPYTGNNFCVRTGFEASCEPQLDNFLINFKDLAISFSQTFA